MACINEPISTPIMASGPNSSRSSAGDRLSFCSSTPWIPSSFAISTWSTIVRIVDVSLQSGITSRAISRITSSDISPGSSTTQAHPPSMAICTNSGTEKRLFSLAINCNMRIVFIVISLYRNAKLTTFHQ